MSPTPTRPRSSSSQTGVDALAIAIGTSHGAYKFNKKPDGSVLKMDVLIEIHRRLPNTHLVMHGSSSVPQDLQDIINKYGGKLKPTWGVPVEEIQLGIKNGVRKINVDTDNRLAITGAIRKVFIEKPEKFDPRDYLKPARDAMKKVVAQRMIEFGQAGHANDFTPAPAGGDGGVLPAASRRVNTQFLIMAPGPKGRALFFSREVRAGLAIRFVAEVLLPFVGSEVASQAGAGVAD